MSYLIDAGRDVVPVEYFAAKDNAGLIMVVPKRCGLSKANSIKIDGLAMIAMNGGDILAITMPPLTSELRDQLVHLASQGSKLHVGEFMARGLVDAYSLDIII